MGTNKLRIFCKSKSPSTCENFCFNFSFSTPPCDSSTRNRVHRNHTTLQLKLKKQLIYNCCVTIPWVSQLLCNYPLRNMVY
jgi:hypothetical protein